MNKVLVVALVLFFGGFNAMAAKDFFALTAKDVEGKPVKLESYRGKVVLVANTASECGYTSQYEQLQKVYERFKAKGLVVLGFPANDFGGQEPGTNQEIAKFCKLNYGVTFPLFDKQPVSGAQKQSVFRFLTESADKKLQGEVKWNFEKFLISKTGKLAARYSSQVKPDAAELVATIERLLAEK